VSASIAAPPKNVGDEFADARADEMHHHTLCGKRCVDGGNRRAMHAVGN
jgi:hypothetical protein